MDDFVYVDNSQTIILLGNEALDYTRDLFHYGTKRHSGRYPWGSGDHPFQRSGDFLARVEELKGQGYTPAMIRDELGMTNQSYKTQLRLAKAERRQLLVDEAKSLQKRGYNTSEIGRQLGVPGSTVRGYLDESKQAKRKEVEATVDFLREQVDNKKMVDISTGVERELGISSQRLKTAVEELKMEGYNVYPGRMEQITNPNRMTTMTVLASPDVEHKEIYDWDKVHSLKDYTSHDSGDSFDKKFVYPESMDINRLQVRYAEDGGIHKDGNIEIRRGVPDLSLGESRYAQVRILVDGDRYLKGMATYSDDLPDGIDVVFNTNKKKGTPVRDVLKKVKTDKDGNIDRDNPFGSLIKEGVNDPDLKTRSGGQSYYYDKDGKKKLSLINKRADEGDWGEWAKNIPSQFLAKQNMDLINRQLNQTIDDKKNEFNEIMSLTNPSVKKKMLMDYAQSCDKQAVTLKAAALPGQRFQVMLPLTSIKDNEIYAPNYTDGDTVALVRYPHGGTFEIPILKVNNKNKEGRKVMGSTPADAIGINSSVAERLSGADFDGDTVMVIPCNSPKSKIHITSTPQLEGLKGFDPKLQYGGKEPGTFTPMTKANTQKQMGIASNLIMDMTIRGASEDELAAATRHSMVVIDAEKHKLDYKQSEKDNNISALKKRYQRHVDPDTGEVKYGGASTLLTKAKSETSVRATKGDPHINRKTGALEWEYIDEKSGKLVSKYNPESWVDKKGNVKYRMKKSNAMSDTNDARTLSSGTAREEAYAKFANACKTYANEARKTAVSITPPSKDKEAEAKYAKEVDSLMAKLNIAKLNAPKEREAQRRAYAEIEKKKEEYPDLKEKGNKAELKKYQQKALSRARSEVGAKRMPIIPTEKEWEAIQANALSPTTLDSILELADPDVIRNFATPKTGVSLTTSQEARILRLYASGYTTAQIADAVNVSSSTVYNILKPQKGDSK